MSALDRYCIPSIQTEAKKSSRGTSSRKTFRSFCVIIVLLTELGMGRTGAAFAVTPQAASVTWKMTPGDNLIEDIPDGVHVNQRDFKDTNSFALARAILNLGDSAAWRISFDVRYGKARSVGGTVKLGAGDAVIGAIGNNAWGTTIYVGNDTAKSWQSLDAKWHHLDFVCDGQNIVTWADGKQFWKERSQGTPDNIVIGSWAEGSWLGQQSEISARHIIVESLDPAEATLLSTDPSRAAPRPTIGQPRIPSDIKTAAVRITSTAKDSRPQRVDSSRVHKDFAEKDATIAALKAALAANRNRSRQLESMNDQLQGALAQASRTGTNTTIVNNTVNYNTSNVLVNLPPTQGSAHLDMCHLLFSNSGDGSEFCAGRVTIVNDGAFAITTFRLAVRVNGEAYVLVPFQGSLLYPEPLINRRISPGHYLSVAVMTTGDYSSWSTLGTHEIELEADVAGPPYVVSDEQTVF